MSSFFKIWSVWVPYNPNNTIERCRGCACCVYLCVCVCVRLCECVLWEASFVTGILPSSLFRESWVALFETCCQISGFHFLSFVLFFVVDWHAFCSFECVLYLKSCYVLYVHYVFVMLSFKMFAVECPSDMHVRTHTHTHALTQFCLQFVACGLSSFHVCVFPFAHLDLNLI